MGHCNLLVATAALVPKGQLDQGQYPPPVNLYAVPEKRRRGRTFNGHPP